MLLSAFGWLLNALLSTAEGASLLRAAKYVLGPFDDGLATFV